MVDRPLLVDSEVTGGEITDVVFPTLLRTYWYPRLAQRITEATSPASMAARQWHAMVDSPSLVMARLGGCGYSIRRS